MSTVRTVGIILAVVAFAFFWGGRETSRFIIYETDTAEAVAVTPPAEVRQPPVTCLTVPAGIVSDITGGLTVGGGGSLRGARAVRSGSHRNAYFVSADIQGSGMNDSKDVGTWIVSGTLANPGTYASVNSYANEFSVFPNAGRQRSSASMSDPGARESARCVP